MHFHNMVQYSPGWSQTYCRAEDDLGQLHHTGSVSISPVLGSQVCVSAPVQGCNGLESMASCTLEKHSIN